MRWPRWIFAVLLCMPTAAAESVLICVSYLQGGQHVEAMGTAVCIANTDRGSILLTAKHNIEERPDAVWVRHDGDWHQCFAARLSQHADIATVETSLTLEPHPIADDVPVGGEVTVIGAGATLNKTSEGESFRARVVAAEWLVGSRGEHVIHGDSGGPVLVRTESGKAVAGIVSGFEGRAASQPRSRLTYAGRRTVFVPAPVIVQFVQSQYGGCPGGICPIRIRQQIQQPMVGIGLPVGPPRIVNTIEPDPRPVVSAPTVVTGPTGPQGPPGPPGRDGRSVTREQVEATVNAWLEANRDALVGPAGPAGPPGRSGSTPDLTGIETRLRALETRPFRMVVTSDGKIIDDESYSAGEPVVLDLRRLRNVSNAK